MKKFFILSLLILLPSLLWATEVTIDGIYYNLISKTGTAEVIAGDNKYTGSVVIPAKVTYEGTDYPVTAVGDKAFFQCVNLTSVTIPSSVISIGSNAFYQCNKLTSVSIPSSVTTIGSLAFSYCRAITSIIIPESVTSIGSTAFSYCSSLTSIVIPNSVSTFGSDIFMECTSLTEVSLPNNMTSIPNFFFYNCSKLKSIDIPNSVTSIDGYAFYGCTSLTTVDIPNSVTSIGSNAFYGCSALTSVTIGSSIKKINSNAFANCQELTEVYCYAETVPTTDATAFNNSYIDYATLYVPEAAIESYKASAPWSGFKEIKSISSVESDEVQVDGISYLLDKSTNTAEVISSLGDAYSGDVVIPNSIEYNGTTYSVTSIGASAFLRRSNLTSIDLPSTLVSIGDYAFYECTSLASVTLPSSIVTIGELAFFKTCITSVEFPEGLTSIGYGAFAQTNLTSVTIPNSVTSIDYEVFMNCTDLASVTIGSGISEMSKSTFEGCTSLSSITVLRETPATLYSSTFSKVDKTTCVLHVPYGCKSAYASADYWSEFTNIVEADFIHDGLYYSLDFSAKTAKVIASRSTEVTYSGDITVPSTVTCNGTEYAVTAVGDSAFIDCIGLNSVVLSEGVTAIGDYAFAESGLTSITLPNSLKSIGKSVFFYGKLTSITFPEGLTSIGSYAFYGSGLTTVTLPSSITTIENSVFSCSGLTSVTIPNSVTAINYHAFRMCSSLKSIYIPNSVTTIGEGAFDESGLTTVNIPSSVTTIVKNAFKYCNNLKTVNVDDLAAWCSISFENAMSNPLYYAHHLYMDGVEVTELVIPDGVEAVGNFAFNRCTSLTSLTIPQSVTSIGASAFAGCSGITSITAEGETPATIQSTTFTSVSKTNCTLYVPYGCQTAYASASYWSEFENIVEMENSDPDTDISTLDEALYIEAMEGRVGGTMDLSIKLKSTEAARGFQFILEVPEGVTINGWALSENRLPTGATTNNKISSFKIDGNKITVACTLNYGSATFTGNDGEVATVNVTFGGDMNEGTYSLFLTDCGYSNAAGNDLLLEDVKSSVTLESYLVGDANGDSLVRIGDVTAILNYIIGKVPDGFNVKAADANEDGQIRIGDVTTVLNIIMGIQ